ncbi:phosphoesterase, partial [Escherichia coli]|nr:phosphoesterase [Escherichia coli]
MAIMRLSQLNWLTSGILATFLACLLTGCGGASDAANSTGGPSAAVSPAPVSPPAQAPVTPTASRIGHVFVIVLENKGYT